jgi:rRNA maturation endonuclease Nob1
MASLYLKYNRCIGCKLFYPKDIKRCTVCKQMLRTKRRVYESEHAKIQARVYQSMSQRGLIP